MRVMKKETKKDGWKERNEWTEEERKKEGKGGQKKIMSKNK